MIILVGASGSGKDTVKKILVDQYEFTDLVLYTTRPMREGEVNDKDYHFIDTEEFLRLKDEKFFAETAEYNGWFYGSAIRDYKPTTAVVLTPKGMREIKRVRLDLEKTTYYINTPRRVRLTRCLSRGDDVDEAIRRNISDVGQFDGIEDEVDYVVSGLLNPQDIADVIAKTSTRE